MDKETLIEIRKAYRLLFDYQDRILKLMNFIEKNYEIPYAGGRPKFTRKSSPQKDQGSLQNWAWDWLNMYYYEFSFQKKLKDQNNLIFSVFLVNDTGFYEAINSGEKASKVDLQSFKSVENSETKLVFVASLSKDWDEDWDNWQKPAFILSDEGNPTNCNLIFRSYPLEEFASEDEAIECLKDFSLYAQKYKIPIKISENRLKTKSSK